MRDCRGRPKQTQKNPLSWRALSARALIYHGRYHPCVHSQLLVNSFVLESPTEVPQCRTPIGVQLTSRNTQHICQLFTG